MSKRKKYLYGAYFILSSLLFLVIFGYIIITGKNFEHLEDTRDKSFDQQELFIQGINSELLRYFAIRSESDWKYAKNNSMMTGDLRNILYGYSYDRLFFNTKPSLKVNDIYYSLDKDNLYYMYDVTVKTTLGSKNYVIEIHVKDNQILDFNVI